MFAIHESVQDKCCINVLPCRIQHNGPVKVTKRYWNPTLKPDQFKIAHFRGRRLRGKCVKLPAGYEGAVIKLSDRSIPTTALRQTIESCPEQVEEGEEDEVDGSEPELPQTTKVIERISTFDDLVIYGHDHLPSKDDNLVKGIEEWISLTEAVHKS